MNIVIIKYNAGNVHSVRSALQRLGVEPTLSDDPEIIKKADKVIFPGVGEASTARKYLDNKNLSGLLVSLKQPVLGICLGLQLLFESSEEGKCQGLGLLPGRVKQLPNNQGERIPHMGWGKLQIDRPSPLLPDPSSAEWMYFVHSFAAEPQETRDRAASVAFGSGLATAVVWRNRLGACQFHPEKSAVTGQRLLSRWLEWLQQGAPLMP